MIETNYDQDESSFLSKAKAHFSNQEFEEAIELFKKALSLNSQNSLTHSNLALCHFKLFNYELALESSKSAISSSASNMKALILACKSSFNLFLISQEKDKLSESKEFLNKALALSTHSDFSNYTPIIEPISLKINAAVSFCHYDQKNQKKTFLMNYYLQNLDLNACKILENYMKAESISAPSALYCPITLDLFCNPVCTSVGHTYEKEFLIKYFKFKGCIDPNTNQPLAPQSLYVNLCIMQAKEKMLEECPWLESESCLKINELFW